MHPHTELTIYIGEGGTRYTHCKTKFIFIYTHIPSDGGNKLSTIETEA